jgi:hypothetical protein
LAATNASPQHNANPSFPSAKPPLNAGKKSRTPSALADRVVGMRRLYPGLLASPPFPTRRASVVLSRRLRRHLHHRAGRPTPAHLLSSPWLPPSASRQRNGILTLAKPPLLEPSRTSRIATSPFPSPARAAASLAAVEEDSGSGPSSSTRIPVLESAAFNPATLPKLPFRFDTGIALFAKRAPRPFPPPFLSPPSGSFSDPLSTHHYERGRGRGADRRATFVDGQRIQGATNGDDAVFASDYFICANDGVGAWSTRPRGHAG